MIDNSNNNNNNNTNNTNNMNNQMSLPSAHILSSNISINTLLQMSNVDASCGLESKNIFKGISTFADHIGLEPSISMTALNTEKPKKNLNCEKTIDLTELVLQEQMLFSSNPNMMIKDEDGLEPKSLSQMQPVQSFDHRNMVIPLEMIDRIKQDMGSKSRSTGTSENEDDEEEDDSSQHDSTNDSTYFSSNNQITHNSNNASKPEAKKRGRRPLSSLKRLDTSTNLPLGTSSGEKEKRGRKPGSATAKKSKKQLLLEKQIEEERIARFGNKYVEKGTDEYKVRRDRNNDAVKKCRQKLNAKQEEREKRMKILTDENQKLNNTVDSLHKELNVLKNIMLQMSPQMKLPENIEKMIKNIESS